MTDRVAGQNERTPHDDQTTDPMYDIGTAVTRKNLEEMPLSKEKNTNNSGHI